jgi:hypothetical protein
MRYAIVVIEEMHSGLRTMTGGWLCLTAAGLMIVIMGLRERNRPSRRRVTFGREALMDEESCCDRFVLLPGLVHLRTSAQGVVR